MGFSGGTLMGKKYRVTPSGVADVHSFVGGKESRKESPGAGDGIRTHDSLLGKQILYH